MSGHDDLDGRVVVGRGTAVGIDVVEVWVVGDVGEVIVGTGDVAGGGAEAVVEGRVEVVYAPGGVAHTSAYCEMLAAQG